MAICDARKLIIISEILTSSSSSDDEIDILIGEKRKKTRIENFIEIIHEFSDEEFKNTFRLKRTTTYRIIEEYESSPFYPSDVNHGGSLPLSAEHDFLTFLCFCGNKVSLRDVALRFGVAESTTFQQIERVMEFLVSIAPAVIKFPENKEQAARNFSDIASFPGVLGCIDGSSITIRTPAKKLKSTYVNRHDIPSITLQAVCDAKKKFIDVSVGTPGKIHNARVFKLSDISKELPRICNGDYHLLGDSAYPIREWLLVPFRDYGNLTQQQKLYNKRFCATRVVIENSFGILKGRFRQLLEVHMYKVDKICKFIISFCVLHNYCIEYSDEYNFLPVYEDAVAMEDDHDDTERQLKRLGEIKRNHIMEQFNDGDEEY